MVEQYVSILSSGIKIFAYYKNIVCLPEGILQFIQCLKGMYDGSGTETLFHQRVHRIAAVRIFVIRRKGNGPVVLLRTQQLQSHEQAEGQANIQYVLPVFTHYLESWVTRFASIHRTPA
jgi:hypothetical protein